MDYKDYTGSLEYSQEDTTPPSGPQRYMRRSLLW